MFVFLREVNAIMKRSNVRCPVCGQLNEGLDLEETEGWAECCKCKVVFMAPSYARQSFNQKLPLVNLPDHAVKAVKA